MFDPSDLDTITGAYHEAGHVVMAHMLGGEVVHVTIENDDDELLGLTTVRWRKSDDAERRRCSALVALAGPVAETRWRGEADLLDMMRKRLYWTTRAIEGECVVDEHGVPVEGLRIKRKGKRVRLEYEA